LPFCDKTTYIKKLKLLSIFVSTGQRVKQSNKASQNKLQRVKIDEQNIKVFMKIAQSKRFIKIHDKKNR